MFLFPIIYFQFVTFKSFFLHFALNPHPTWYSRFRLHWEKLSQLRSNSLSRRPSNDSEVSV
jgi:hypothetical protein